MARSSTQSAANGWRVVHRSPSIIIGDYRCRVHGCGRGREETSKGHDFALPRSGMFVKHVRGEDVVAEPNTVLFFNADEPYQVSHPGGPSDRCTTFAASPQTLLDALARRDPSVADHPDRPFARSHAACDGALFLAHRTLLSRAASGEADSVELDERAFDVLDRVAAAASAQPSIRLRRRVRADTLVAHREVVQAAKLAMAARFSQRLTLEEIAVEACSSPYHLSRVFRSLVGASLHAHLRRLRLRNALEAMLDDRMDLTSVALRNGFFDHSHFSNAFRSEFGFTPSQCRARLSRGGLRQMSRDFQVA